MSNRPSFQFYPADWRKDPSLSVCSMAAKGLWIELLCIAHESGCYGVLEINGKPMSVQQIARSVGESPASVSKLLAELESAGVFSRREDGAILSRRMLRDEHIRKVRTDAGKQGGNPNLLKQNTSNLLKQNDKQSPTPSSSSSSSNNTNPLTPSELSPPCEKPVILDSKTSSGTRLPSDWKPPPEYLSFAVNELHDKSPPEIMRIADGFRDYWIAQPGTKGRKTDWLATWRNWIRREAERYENTGKNSPNNLRKPAPESVVDRVARANGLVKTADGRFVFPDEIDQPFLDADDRVIRLSMGQSERG